MISYIILLKAIVFFFQPANMVSFTMESKTLDKGKVVKATGEVFYRQSDGLMITKFSYPYEYYVFVNGKGEMKMYDPKLNEVMLRENKELSSENSFFNFYLRNGGGDLGLTAAGFQVFRTFKKDDLIVTEWRSKTAQDIGKIELASEKNVPISMIVYNGKMIVSTKTYYSKFMKIGGVDFPGSVTDITFRSKTDSVISKRVYTNAKVGQNVDQKIFSFKIPSDAKVHN